MYAILNSSIRAFSTANLLHTVLNFFSVKFDAIFTYQFFEFENALCNSPKIVQHKKYIKNIQLKTLKPVLPQCSHNYVSQFWFCCSPNRNPILNWDQHGLILYFHFIFKLTKAEVLIYRHVDGHSQTYSYKKVLQIYAANLYVGPYWVVPS